MSAVKIFGFLELEQKWGCYKGLTLSDRWMVDRSSVYFHNVPLNENIKSYK
jgi:hypothetical protein